MQRRDQEDLLEVIFNHFIRSLDVGSSLEEAGLYISVNVHGMHVKLLGDIGATLTLLSQTLYKTIPQQDGPRLQNSKEKL